MSSSQAGKWAIRFPLKFCNLVQKANLFLHPVILKKGGKNEKWQFLSPKFTHSPQIDCKFAITLFGNMCMLLEKKTDRVIEEGKICSFFKHVCRRWQIHSIKTTYLSSGPEFEPQGEIFSNLNRIIAHSLSLPPAHNPNMTVILLKRTSTCKSFINPSIKEISYYVGKIRFIFLKAGLYYSASCFTEKKTTETKVFVLILQKIVYFMSNPIWEERNI